MTISGSTPGLAFLRTADLPGLLARSSLPRPLTSLVGRETERAAVLELLADPRGRLVTLTGAGGVGKTRLALEAAHAVADRFHGRVWFISLATLSEPTMVVTAIAEGLGLPAADERGTIERLHYALGDEPALVVLDNMEHLLAAAPALAGLLEACGGLTLLVTSREALRVRGERELLLPPLTLPEGDTLSPADAQSFAAVALYVQRTREVRPDFVLSDDNVPAVVQICRRLDGLPLAIELAAARSRILPPTALAGRIERRLSLLTGGARDLPARQQTMHDAIAWSYDLLTPDEQHLFRRLTVFAGGFTLEAAEAVGGQGGRGAGGQDERSPSPCPPVPLPPSVLDGIASLLEKSLIREVGGTEDRRRYAMLETIREFGHDRLVESGEAAEIRRRHAAWYGELAEETWKRLYHEPVDGHFLARVDVEHDDVRAALAWLEQTDDLVGLLTVAGAIGPLWYFRSHRSEGLEWLRRGLRRLPDPRVPAAIEARALHMAGSLSEGKPEAVELLVESIRIWQDLGDRWGVAASSYELAKHLNGRGEYARAAAYAAAAIPVFAEFGNPEWQADATAQIGVAAFDEGRVEEALEYVEQALTMGRQIEDWYGIGLALHLQAVIAGESGDPARAAAAYRESLDAWTRIGNKEGLTGALAGIGALAAAQGRHELAAHLLGAADNLATAIGYRLALPLRDFVDRARTVASEALGADTYDRKYAGGRTASLGASIAVAADFTENPVAGAPRTRTPSDLSEEANSAGLTPRELEVLRLLAEGRTDREIGELLSISRATAARHVANILLKLDVNSRTQAAAYAFRQGLA